MLIMNIHICITISLFYWFTMPVSTRSWANSQDNEQKLRAQTSCKRLPQVEIPMLEIWASNNWKMPRNISDIGDVPISNESVGLNSGSAPPLTLLQQHMDVLELRELVSKLSDNQASMDGLPSITDWTTSRQKSGFFTLSQNVS